jgi:hypothetical protein
MDINEIYEVYVNIVISEGQITQPPTVVVGQAVIKRTLSFTGEADSAVMPEEE